MVSRSADEGFTLVELMFASALMLIALAMFGASLFVATKMQLREGEYSRANDAVHLALQELDRQIRSGYVVTDTALVTGTDDAVKIYTEAGGTPRCVIWALTGNPGTQSLYTTSWSPGVVGGSPSSFSASTWRLVATDIVNSKNTALLPLASAFLSVNQGANVDPLPGLQVRLFVNSSSRSEQAIEVQSLFTSRNAERSPEAVTGLNNVIKVSACGS